MEIKPVREQVSDETMAKLRLAVAALPLRRLRELRAYLDGVMKVAEKDDA